MSTDRRENIKSHAAARRICARLLRASAVAALWLGVWFAAAEAIGRELLLPSPPAVARSLVRLAAASEFWLSIARSMCRILLGYAAGAAGGMLLGAATAHSNLAEAFLSPAMSAVKATPVASIVILLLAWIRGANLSVAVSFLMVLPLVWQAAHTGLRAADPLLLEMAKAFGMRRSAVFRNIVLPPAKPHIAAALRTALGFAWKAGVAGEVIAVSSGTIGMQLYNAKVYLEMPNLFAWTAVVILMSVLLEKLLLFRPHRHSRGSRKDNLRRDYSHGDENGHNN